MLMKMIDETYTKCPFDYQVIEDEINMIFRGKARCNDDPSNIGSINFAILIIQRLVVRRISTLRPPSRVFDPSLQFSNPLLYSEF